MKIRIKPDFDADIALEVGLSRKQVREITSLFLAKVMEALAAQEDVHLDGFGKFRLVVEKAQEKPTTALRAGYPNKKNPPAPRNRIVRIYRKFRVHFSKSTVFNRILRDKYGPGGEENVMEKYGVNEGVDQESLEKQASDGCPNCGRQNLTKHGSILICPSCGTEPFENPSRKR